MQQKDFQSRSCLNYFGKAQRVVWNFLSTFFIIGMGGLGQKIGSERNFKENISCWLLCWGLCHGCGYW